MAASRVPVACSCLNTRLTLAESDARVDFGTTTGSLHQPAAGVLVAPLDSISDRNERFFAMACAVKDVRGETTVFPSLLHERCAQHGDLVYSIKRCLNCAEDLYAVADTVVLANLSRLVIGRQALETVRLQAGYCPAFEVVLPPNLSRREEKRQLLVEGAEDTPAVAAVSANLHRRVTEFLQHEQRIMDARVETYRQQQQNQFNKLSERVSNEEIAMFRNILRLQQLGSKSYPPSPDTKIQIPLMRFPPTLKPSAMPVAMVSPTAAAVDDDDMFMFEEETSERPTHDLNDPRFDDGDGTVDQDVTAIDRAEEATVPEEETSMLSMSLPIDIPVHGNAREHRSKVASELSKSVRPEHMAASIREMSLRNRLGAEGGVLPESPDLT